MKRILSLLLLSLVVLAACGKQTTESNECDGDNPTIGLVTDIGGIDDKSFNQGAWEGIEAYCKESSQSATYIETKDPADRLKNLETMAKTDGIEVVVATGMNFEADIDTVAKENQNIKFILVDGAPFDASANGGEGAYEDLDNVKSLFFDETQAGYLAGYISGKTTTTNRIGFIGGMQIPPVQNFGSGYVQGAKDANKDIIVDYSYVGNFDDPTTAKTTADTYYEQGADIIFTAAGGSNEGVINAAKARTTSGTTSWVVGVDVDMYDQGLYDKENNKSVILTSAVKGVDSATTLALKEYFEGKFTSGATTYTYDDGGVGIPDENPNLDQAVIDEATAAFKKSNIEKDYAKVNANKELNINGEI